MTERRQYPLYKPSRSYWLGDIPEGWDTCALGRLVRFRNGADYSEVEVEEGGYPVYGSGGEFRRASDYLFDGESVLFGRKGTIDRPLHVDGRFWTVDTMYFTDIDTSELLPRFLYYWATQLPYGYWLTSTALPSMTQSDLSSAMIPYISLAEQGSIVRFLDRETAEIDAFIADQKELIGLLAERRDASWQSALDELHVPDVALRRVIDSIVDGPFGSSLTSAHYTEGGARVVRLGNIGINQFKDTDQAFISTDYFAELNSHSVREGDVIIAGLGDDRMPLGRAAVVPDIGPAIVKADCYRVRPGSLVTGEYLAWVLSAPQSRARMRELSRGSTRQRLNTSVVRDVAIPLPTIAAQVRVLSASRETHKELDAVIADASRAIELSRELRAALISAAVTGKIDVREHGVMA